MSDELMPGASALLQEAAEGNDLSWKRLREMFVARGPAIARRAILWRAFADSACLSAIQRISSVPAGSRVRDLFPVEGTDDAVESRLEALILETFSSRETALLERVVSRSAEARHEFFATYQQPLLELWRRHRARKRTDLDGDFVHWFLTDWIARPDASFEYLERKYLADARRRPQAQFLLWWIASAPRRWTDFSREKVQGRHEKSLLVARGEAALSVPDASEDGMPAAERAFVVRDAVAAFDDCLSELERPGSIANDGALVLSLERGLAARTAGGFVDLLWRLGFEIRGDELVTRRGRRTRDQVSLSRALTAVGQCLKRRGFSEQEVRLALPTLIERLEPKSSEGRG